MRDAGLTPPVFVAPILPELIDSTKQADELLGVLAAVGAGDILRAPLYLMRGVCSLPRPRTGTGEALQSHGLRFPTA
ncbi:hypothetical protein [Micromonospora sp. NPDC003776]